MKRVTAAIGFLAAAAALSAPVKEEGGHTVLLSTGETVRVAFTETIAVDPATHRAAGGTSNVLFQSSQGTRIAMRTTTTASRKVDTVIWSVDGPDRLGFEMDLAPRRKGAPVPVSIDINGERASIPVEGDSPAEDDRVRDRIAPRVAALPPAFRSALKELLHLGQGSYEHSGGGWIELRYLFGGPEAGSPVSIVSKREMTADERDRFVKAFAPK